MTAKQQSQQPRGQSYDQWIGETAYDTNGEKIGEITDIFYDDRTRRPEWVAIKSGMFKGNVFAPIQGSTSRADEDGGLQLNYTKDHIKDAPKVASADDHMSADEERELWSHYGYDYGVDADARRTDYGYGPDYTNANRADKDFAHRRWNDQTNDWTDERRMDEHTEEVPITTQAQVTVPVEANVRLRRYQTQNQKTETRQVQVPVTETEEHTEVVGVDAQAKTPSTKGTTRK